MLGLDNPIHLAFILVLLLLVFGAKRLPEMGRSLGSGLRGFKESITGEESSAPLHTDHVAVTEAEATMPAQVDWDEATGPTAEHTPRQPVA